MQSQGSAVIHQCVNLKVHLKSQKGQYVRAEGGGGEIVRANAPQAKEWETFEMSVVGGGPLLSGSKVQFRTVLGKFLTAEKGGGAAVSAYHPVAKEWETFEILDHDSAPGMPIAANAHISLKTWNGSFLSAKDGGGGDMGTKPWARQWETFTIEFQVNTCKA